MAHLCFPGQPISPHKMGTSYNWCDEAIYRDYNPIGRGPCCTRVIFFVA